ncbi:hypothetical protein [Flavobacterium sp. XGLA_31]|uniref:hypothetical protein n=1 Tax=Flavobacterium sp. XGLA_31 TaxID=3447666 RepID=UPI003F378132
MKSFKLFIIVILSIFILDKIVFFCLLQVDKRVFVGEGVGKLNQFLKLKDTTEIIFFGNSRTNHHINPKMFGKSSYNMGVNGRKMAFSATLIQTLPKNKKQFVVLQLDPNNVFEKDYAGDDMDALLVKYHQNRIIRKKLIEMSRNNYFSSVMWSLDYNGLVLSLLRNFVKPKYNYKKYNGYDPIKNNKAQKAIFLKKLKRNGRKNKCEETYQASDINNTCLDEIVAFCKVNNKALIVFTSPVYKDKCKKDNTAMKQLMESKGIKYYDFTDFYAKNDNLDYWKDEEHLSKIGAEEFSVYLADFLKNDLK